MQSQHRPGSADIVSCRLRGNLSRLGFASACGALIAALALVPLSASAASGATAPRRAARSRRRAQASKGQLTRKQLIALIKRYAKKYAITGPQGPEGKQGPAGADGTNAIAGPPTGPAGGDLTGTYPTPQLGAEVVRTANFATGAVAPEAELFGGFLPAAFQKRVSGECASGEAMRKIDAAGAVTCLATGTVTSVGSGTGLTGGPITGSGSLSIDTGYRLPQSCSSGQVAKSDGAGSWTCTTPTSVTQMMGGSIGEVQGNNGYDQYLAPQGLSTASSVPGVHAEGVSALGTTVGNLFVRVFTPPGGDSQWIFTWEVNGNPLGHTCVIAGSNTTCTDTVSQSLAAGDTLELKAQPLNGLSGFPQNTQITFGWTATS